MLDEAIIVEVTGLDIKRIDGSTATRGEVLLSDRLLMGPESVLTRIQQGYLRPRTDDYKREFDDFGPNPKIANVMHDRPPLTNDRRRPLKIKEIENMLEALSQEDDHRWGDGEGKQDDMPEIGSFTNSQLKESLRSRNLPVWGAKIVLVARLKDAIHNGK